MKHEKIDGILDRRRQWKFSLKEQDGTWAWHVSNRTGSEAKSSGPFKTLEECIADAMSHGYVVWDKKERRRPEYPGWDE